jgi:hypothetical protein
MSPELRARLERLTSSQRDKLFSALEATAARGIALDLSEDDFDLILDEITAATPFEVLEALSPRELSALVRADSTVADLTQLVGAATFAVIAARRADVIATFDLADIVARINKRRQWKEANPDPCEDEFRP